MFSLLHSHYVKHCLLFVVYLTCEVSEVTLLPLSGDWLSLQTNVLLFFYCFVLVAMDGMKLHTF